MNPSGAVGQVLTLTVKNHENVGFPKGNPIELRVKPGETITETLLMVESEPFKYHYATSCSACSLKFFHFQPSKRSFGMQLAHPEV